jgi:integrase
MAHVRTLTRSDGTPAFEVRWRQAGRFKQRTFKVKREAERFALRVEVEVDQGNSTDIYVRRSKTLAHVVEASMKASAAKLKSKTLAGYEQAYRLHILPVFGARRITSVTSQDVEMWVVTLTEKGLSPASVRGTFVALNKLFRYAQRHELVAKNPCTGTELPRSDAKRMRCLTPAQVDALAKQLDRHHPYGLIVRFAAYSGLRAGEIAGLQVRDVNLLQKSVRVERTMQRDKHSDKGWTLASPKSERSTRTVPLRASLLVELRDYLDAHPRRGEPAALLWPGRVRGGHGENKSALDYSRPFDHQSFYRYYFKPALAAIHLSGVRFHDLATRTRRSWPLLASTSIR